MEEKCLRNFDSALASDCAECFVKNCEFRKSGNVIATLFVMFFIAIIILTLILLII
jgi:hypothetical protein